VATGELIPARGRRAAPVGEGGRGLDPDLAHEALCTASPAPEADAPST